MNNLYCNRHEYDGDRCPECWKEGPQEMSLFDFDKDRFNQNERLFIEKLNEISEQIREMKSKS